MKALVDAMATSIVAEVTGANTWTVEKAGTIWRDPRRGKVLNIYSDPTRQGEARWTGSTIDIASVVVEYTEPATEQAKKLRRSEAGEQAAEDVADALRTWALSHEAGFTPAYKMDCSEVNYASNLPRQLYVRYCRLVFTFEVVKAYA